MVETYRLTSPAKLTNAAATVSTAIEGLGIVYLEAAAAGLPVLAGDSGGPPDAVRDGETGYVVDGSSVAATADRLVRLLRDRELACTMGEKGRRWVTTDWSWDGSYEDLRELLAVPTHLELLRTGRGPRRVVGQWRPGLNYALRSRTAGSRSGLPRPGRGPWWSGRS